jgi:hypothetical protein
MVLLKLMKLGTKDLASSAEKLSTFLLMSLQRDDKQLKQLVKDIIFEVA